MAKATSITGTKVLVLLGNDADPVVYAAPCAFTEKSITFAKNGNQTEVPECDDPDVIGWMETDLLSRELRISGGGLLVAQSLPTWLAAWDSDEPVPARVEIHFASDNIISRQGLLHVMQLELVGNRGERAQIRVEAQSHGPMEVVA